MTKLVSQKLEIDLFKLFGDLSDEDKKILIGYLSCDESIIKHVTDQILDGLTDNSCCGSIGFHPRPSPTTALDIAIRRVSLRSGEVANREITRMEGEIQRLSDSKDKLIGNNHRKQLNGDAAGSYYEYKQVHYQDYLKEFKRGLCWIIQMRINYDRTKRI